MADFSLEGLLGNIGSAFSGGGNYLDEYLTPEQRAAMQRNAMLSASAALLKAGGESTRRIGIGEALGGAFEAGQAGYEKAQTGALTQMAMKQKMEEAKKAKALNAQLASIMGLSTPGEMESPEVIAKKLMQSGRAAMSAGDFTRGFDFYKQAREVNPPDEVQGAPFEGTDAQGNPIMLQQMKGGTVRPVSGYGVKQGAIGQPIEMTDAQGKPVMVQQMPDGSFRTVAGFTPKRAADKAPRTQQVQLEDGTIGLINMDTGAIIKSSVGGVEAKGKGSESKPTEDQSKSAGFAYRMKQSTDIFNQPALDKAGNPIIDKDTNKQVTLEQAYGKPGRYQAIMRAIPTAGLTTGIANMSEDAQRQQYRQAQENWVTANLRPESGAVIGEGEMEKEITKYFPQVNDDAKTIDQKARARRDTELAMTVRAGPAYKQLQQQIPKQRQPRLVKDPVTGITRYVEE